MQIDRKTGCEGGRPSGRLPVDPQQRWHSGQVVVPAAIASSAMLSTANPLRPSGSSWRASGADPNICLHMTSSVDPYSASHWKTGWKNNFTAPEISSLWIRVRDLNLFKPHIF